MFVTLSGSGMLVVPEQEVNAAFPMLLTLLGMVTLAKLVQ